MSRLEVIVHTANAVPGNRSTFASAALRGLAARAAATLLLIFCLLAPTGPLQAEVRDAALDFQQPTSVRAIYRALADHMGFRVVFDPKLRDQSLTIDLTGLEQQEALLLLTKAAGHMTRDLGDDKLLVAHDTPNNRRTYSSQVAQVVTLENLPIKDAMTILRSLFGIKHIAAQEELRQLVIRDDAARVELAMALLARIDKPRGEVEVGIEVFHVTADQRQRLLAQWAQDGDTAGTVPQRLRAAQLNQLRGTARAVASPSVTVLDGDQGQVVMTERHRVGGRSADGSAESADWVSLGMELAVESRLHPKDDATTLHVELGVSDLTPDDASSVVRQRSVQSSLRLEEGQSLLLQGILPTGDGSAWLPGWIGSPEAVEKGGEVLITLTPRIVRRANYSAADLAAVCAGTETHLGLCT